MRKLFLENFFSLFLILTISLIVFFIGINDIEEYSLGSFSSKILWNNQYGLLTFFYDFYGPGVKIPFGTGNLFHPLNYFIEYTKYYYLFFIFLHLFLQLLFTKRIFKLLKINSSYYLLPLLSLFGAPNLQYVLINDWPSVFFSYTFFPLIFYYLLKIIDTQKFLSYIKLIIFTHLWLLNGHIGVIAIYSFFLLIYFLLSIKNSNHLKKIFNKYFLLSTFFFIFLIADYLNYNVDSFREFEKILTREYNYTLGSFIQIFYPFNEFLTWLSADRLPGNPILIYFSLFSSIYLLIRYMYLNISSEKNLKLKNIIYELYFNIVTNVGIKFSILFLIFILLSLYEPPFYRTIVSQGIIARDVFLFSGLVLFFYMYPKIKNKFKKAIPVLLIFYTLLLFCINLFDLYSNKENNFIVDKVKSSNLTNIFSNLNLDSIELNRIYLSPQIYKNINKNFKKEGFFGLPDFTKYNLAPFNGFFKYNSMKGFSKDQRMLGEIPSKYKYLNNSFFLDLFDIKYLLISEKDLPKFNQSNNSKIVSIKTEKDTLHLFKRKIINYSLNELSFNSLQEKLKSCDDLPIDCIIANRKLFILDKAKLIRLSNGHFLIKEMNNNYLFLPFIFDKNWEVNKGKILSTNNFFMFLKTNNDKVKNIEIKYADNKRFLLKIISISMLLFLIFLIVFVKSRKILIKSN